MRKKNHSLTLTGHTTFGKGSPVNMWPWRLKNSHLSVKFSLLLTKMSGCLLTCKSPNQHFPDASGNTGKSWLVSEALTLFRLIILFGQAWTCQWMLTMFLGFDMRKCWATWAGSRLNRILLLSSFTFSMSPLSSSAWTPSAINTRGRRGESLQM